MNESIIANWNVRDLNKHRRQSILTKCKGDTIMASKILLKHSKQSKDPEIRNKARSDALYFIALTK